MKSRKFSEEQLRLTATHEAGHTLVAHYTKGADKLHKVTIISKGNSGGHTGFIPGNEYSQTFKELEARIDACMG